MYDDFFFFFENEKLNLNFFLAHGFRISACQVNTNVMDFFRFILSNVTLFLINITRKQFLKLSKRRLTRIYLSP